MQDTVEYFSELEPDLWCYTFVQAVSKVLNRMTSHTHSLTNLEMVMYNRLIPTVRIIHAAHYLIKAWCTHCAVYITFVYNVLSVDVIALPPDFKKILF